MAVCGARYGTLSSAERDRLPSKAFGLPETRQYPMPDSSHAKNAKARAAQQLAAGNLSRRDYNRVVRKADKIIMGCSGETVAKKRRKKTTKKRGKKRAKKRTAKRKTKRRAKKRTKKAAPKKKVSIGTHLRAATGV